MDTDQGGGQLDRVTADGPQGRGYRDDESRRQQGQGDSDGECHSEPEDATAEGHLYRHDLSNCETIDGRGTAGRQQGQGDSDGECHSEPEDATAEGHLYRHYLSNWEPIDGSGTAGRQQGQGDSDDQSLLVPAINDGETADRPWRHWVEGDQAWLDDPQFGFAATHLVVVADSDHAGSGVPIRWNGSPSMAPFHVDQQYLQHLDDIPPRSTANSPNRIARVRTGGVSTMENRTFSL